MIWIALAAQLTAPVPINFSEAFRDEMPISVFNAGVTRVVLIRTIVRPDGSVQGCEVERGSGNADLDAVTCAIIRKKGRFRAARAADGSAAFGVYRDSFKWVPHADDPNLFHPDVEVTLDQFPKGLHAPMTLRVAFAVDELGHPSSCVNFPKPGASARLGQFAGIACDHLLNGYKPVPARGDSGRPVPSIQDATVEFLKGK
jgi:hypothetical protein